MREVKEIFIDEQLTLNEVDYWANGKVYVYGTLEENVVSGEYWGAMVIQSSYEFIPDNEFDLDLEFNLMDNNETPVTDKETLVKLENKVKELALNYVDFED